MNKGEELNLRILEIIGQANNSSGGKCGITPAKICLELDMEYKDVKESLNELFESEKIKVRDGINGYLLFKA